MAFFISLEPSPRELVSIMKPSERGVPVATLATACRFKTAVSSTLQTAILAVWGMRSRVF